MTIRRIFSILLCVVPAGYAAAVSAGEPPLWRAANGEIALTFKPMILADLGLQVTSDDAPGGSGTTRVYGPTRGTLEFQRLASGTLVFHSGRLTVSAALRFSRQGREFSTTGIAITPQAEIGNGVLRISDSQGRVLFSAAMPRTRFDTRRQQVFFEHMDLRLTAEFAQRLGDERLAGLFVGELNLSSLLHAPAIPVVAASCAGRPYWTTDGYTADLGLIDMADIADVGTVTTPDGVLDLITPRSLMKNLVDLSGADIPWFEKFSGTFPPFNNDQHPYLIWNLYRIADGRLEQLGRSGAKHGIMAMNANCLIECGDGGIPGADHHILWPGCEDEYGIGINDWDCGIGPRDEVNPRTGVFVSSGSFFDQNGDGVEDHCSTAPGENRLRVLRQDLQTANAEYYFESWGVNRDDSQIFNSMGYHHFTSHQLFGDTWVFQLAPFVTGPVVDLWVDPLAPGAGEWSALYSTPGVGRFKLAVRTVDLGDGTWRYDYFAMNFDVDREVSGFELDSDANTTIADFEFHDADQQSSNAWSMTRLPLAVRFTAPVENPIPWGTGYTFSFTADAPPDQGAAELTLAAAGTPQRFSLATLVPRLPEMFFRDGFE